jgi:hypothetical protein
MHQQGIGPQPGSMVTAESSPVRRSVERLMAVISSAATAARAPRYSALCRGQQTLVLYGTVAEAHQDVMP